LLQKRAVGASPETPSHHWDILMMSMMIVMMSMMIVMIMMMMSMMIVMIMIVIIVMMIVIVMKRIDSIPDDDTHSCSDGTGEQRNEHQEVEA
jgi:Ca2+/Na+ antiporter